MKVIDPGHVYDLDWIDGEPDYLLNRLIFVKREGDKYPRNVGSHPGTQMQEVLRAIIDRLKYVDNQIHDEMNDNVLYHLRRAILLLEYRAAKRHGLSLPGEVLMQQHRIEDAPVCKKCGHVVCNHADEDVSSVTKHP